MICVLYFTKSTHLNFYTLYLNYFRFLFTELDPGDPSRKFAFVLFVNDDEKYDIIDCDPIIDGKILKDILEELNEKEREDMSLLVRRMRKFLIVILCH